ncbi:hypothetical protein BDZ89DRAFT_1070497 [Hymenopellis radicata]|nr:hypothetical protein BDZ89DRAFT_1070497 [Hymenopellis radicata]
MIFSILDNILNMLTGLSEIHHSAAASSNTLPTAPSSPNPNPLIDPPSPLYICRPSNDALRHQYQSTPSPTHCPRSSVSTGPFRLLPPELLDLIISHLAHDRATLLLCALVHPTWTSISRYHLTLTLTIAPLSRARELTNLLLSSGETLSLSITGIVLVGVGGILPPRNWSEESPLARSYDELLHALKAKGTMLRSGSVKNDPSLVGIFAQYFPDLTTFQVAPACGPDIKIFMRALSGSFPRVVELDIDLIMFLIDVPNASLSGFRDVRLAMPCLRTLRVISWSNELVRWLGDNVVGTLERLELESRSRQLACRLGEAITLIERNKGTLRDLRLIFVKRDVTFDLSGLVRLEHLEVASREWEMDVALNGWKLPTCLRGDTGRVDMGPGIFLEGAVLQRALGM